MADLITIEQVTKDLVPDGSFVAIGGVHSHNGPMSLIRQIIRNETKNLTVLGSISTGLPIDLLVAAKAVKKILAPYVGMEMWGLAPNYRKAVEQGLVEAPDVCEAFPIYGLRAAVNGLLFHPFPQEIHEASDIPSQSKYYRKVSDPFTGTEVYAVPALVPDIALIHVQRATKTGDCEHLGSVVLDRLMAEAAKVTIVTCDYLIDKVDPRLVTIPGFMVDYVIPLRGAAFPTSSHGVYAYNEVAIHEYLKASKDPNALSNWINQFRNVSEEKFLSQQTFLTELTGTPNDGDYTISELIACVFSREIRDGEIGICGAVAEIPMAAMRLAEALHAPNLRWIAGGSGYVNPHGILYPSSTDYEMSKGAIARLSMDEVIGIEMTKIDFFFAGGLQIDSIGSANLGGIPSHTGWKLRGPGSVGLPFLPKAGRMYLYTLGHSPRSLVEKVSYVSGPGAVGNGGSRPALLVTNLCVFEWNGKWTLKSLHPGVSLDTVVENTGFDFDIPSEIPTTQPPSKEELSVLRSFDKLGVLR
ncbi:MAG: hypothetical protein D6732_26210 [Methanobacteriota archaeon]|nr:MAG: hypothetical protein D6732_26210 [Euryarchaeota archaeon]